MTMTSPCLAGLMTEISINFELQLRNLERNNTYFWNVCLYVRIFNTLDGRPRKKKDFVLTIKLDQV